MRVPILALFVLLIIQLMTGEARAQDRFAEIEEHQQRLDRVGDAILVSQGRMLQSSSLTEAQEHAYEILNSTYNGLTQTDRELSALYKLMSMLQLVSGDGQVRMARKIVEMQRTYILKTAARQTERVEKLIQKSSDSETSRLLFEARDAHKATTELLQRQ